MNHIELFAGCGGLSLGLEKANFKLILANELSPMAAETFAYNIFAEDLEEIARSGGKQSKALWISSNFKELGSRLRENPFLYPDFGTGETDIPRNPLDLEGKLLIGSIVHLNQLIEKNKKLKSALKGGFGDGEVDLVSGGPPCQSFSLAGLRKRDCDKNSLPWEFAKFAEHIQPKIVVLENVTGILRPFKEDGISYHAWFEIARAFAGKGYYPLCLHINARQSGVPQNRPRFIMIGIRSDIYKRLSKTFNDKEKDLFAPSERLFGATKLGQPFELKQYNYFDSTNKKYTKLFEDSFLKSLVGHKEVSVKEAIDDLRTIRPTQKSKYVYRLNELFHGPVECSLPIKNHDQRKNGEAVQRRFRIYQILQKCSKDTNIQVQNVFKGNSDMISSEAWRELRTHQYLSDSGKRIEFKSASKLVAYLQRHPTKKQTQKALDPLSPAPAALSIPDDACHYGEHELRTLTVREMARIQSFPDGFVFRSKVTTGGKMRRFEVPQYTQVGNAVPPLLGYNIGIAIRALLSRL